LAGAPLLEIPQQCRSIAHGCPDQFPPDQRAQACSRETVWPIVAGNSKLSALAPFAKVADFLNEVLPANAGCIVRNAVYHHSPLEVVSLSRRDTGGFSW
jgi:hypothetical protein